MTQNQGTIYKITNLINGKIYIGQTRQSYIDRFTQHKSHARNYHSNHKLANALRKYGDENFIIEPIEYCSYNLLDEREKYWIQYYDSIKNGYNIMAGGQIEKTYYELENQQDIIDYYYTCHNQQETCKHFNITDYKLRQLLTRYNLPTDHTNYGNAQKEKVKIVELDLEFNSIKECGQYFIDNSICKSKNIRCVEVRLAHDIKRGIPYYNYHVIKI